MIFKEVIRFDLCLRSQCLDRNIEKNIMERVKELLLNKSLQNIGVVIGIDDLVKPIITSGKIKDNGLAQFNIEVGIIVYKPIVGEKLKTSIKSVSMYGFNVQHGPVDIFVNCKKDHGFKVDEVVRIEITNFKYNATESNFTVIAKVAEKKEKK